MHLSLRMIKIYIPGYIDNPSKEEFLCVLCTSAQSSLYTVAVYIGKTDGRKYYLRGK